MEENDQAMASLMMALFTCIFLLYQPAVYEKIQTLRGRLCISSFQMMRAVTSDVDLLNFGSPKKDG
jgi:hypothetical protein